jgi:2-dehydro-3-deoxygalactonokinase
MVGSNLGWKEVPYVPAPASAADIARGRVSYDFDGRQVFILPGVRAQSWWGAPDVMRGEETQIVGAMETLPELRQRDQVLCLPGTHAKLVELSDGRICRLTTTLSGELFALLSEHGTLCDGAPPWDGAPDAAFRRGLERAAGDAPLLHLLFETRARRLTGDLAAEDARAFLSGLIIGSDVGALRSFGPGRVTLVGSERLNALYAEALVQQGIDAQCLDGDRQSVAGLHACRQLWRNSD